MITPVVFSPPNQQHLYARLIKHCHDLDGTKIKVIEAPEPKLKYPAICNWSFRFVCETMKGKPFVWLEADSIPVKAGWLKALSDEWGVAKGFGKSIVWTTDTHPPHDLCTGIGVYGPEAYKLVPEGLSNDGFDGYIAKNHFDKVHKTPLIQHSYGVYDGKGNATLHRSPKVRDDAVIFHKDQFQDLISVEKHFGHSGDLGDVVFALALIKANGGGYLWLHDTPPIRSIRERFDIIEPLLRAQPYIKAVAAGSRKGIQYDLSMFRTKYQPDRALLMSQCLYASNEHGLTATNGAEPWLTVTPSKATKGRVVVARSPRYHNDLFPWSRVLAHYGAACVFIGLKEEHEAFQKEFGVIEHLKTDNLLEVAEAIAGSDLFIGNQSSPNAVAEGLKHPRILEVSTQVPDCIFPNHGVLCYDGYLSELPAAGGKERETFVKTPVFKKLDLLICPPGGWRYPDLPSSTHANVMVGHVAKHLGIKKEDAMPLMYDYNCQINSEFFKDPSAASRYARVLTAIANAQ